MPRRASLPAFAALASFCALFSAPSSQAGIAPPAANPVIASDTSQIETVQTFARKAQPLAVEWYPKIVAALGDKPTNPPKKITIVMDFGYDGVAATSGSEIHVSPKYVAAHPDDLGMIVHELTHVVQSYPKYDPVWLVEGIADYVRFFVYEPKEKRPHPNPDKATARDSYRTTAAFLDWASTRYDKDLVKKLNHELRAGTYEEKTFAQLTGKDLDTLNTEWLTALRAARDAAQTKEKP